MNREHDLKSNKTPSGLDHTTKSSQAESSSTPELSDDQIAAISGGGGVGFPEKGSSQDTGITPAPTDPNANPMMP